MTAAVAGLAAPSSCLPPPPPGPPGSRAVVHGPGFYHRLPPRYAGEYYLHGGRYYYGGRHELGRFRYEGRYYPSRYSHGGRYYYGGLFSPPPPPRP